MRPADSSATVRGVLIRIIDEGGSIQPRRRRSCTRRSKRRRRPCNSPSKKGKAKEEAYGEFLATLDRDPWGRPYKLIRNKMKRAPHTDSLEPELLERVVETLFPQAPDFATPKDGGVPWGHHRTPTGRRRPPPV